MAENRIKINKNKRKEINCKLCRKKVVRNANSQKYCFPCSAKKRRYEKKPKQERLCAVCGREFTTKHNKQILCSRITCKKVYYKVRFRKIYKAEEDNFEHLLQKCRGKYPKSSELK